jgi:hypothetical protein
MSCSGPLTDLSNLQWLDISDTQVTDDGFTGMSKLHNLKLLVTTRSQVTDVGLKELKDLRESGEPLSQRIECLGRRTEGVEGSQELERSGAERL